MLPLRTTFAALLLAGPLAMGPPPAAAQDDAARLDIARALIGPPLALDAPQLDALVERGETRGAIRVIASAAALAPVARGELDAAAVAGLTGELVAAAEEVGAVNVSPLGGLPLVVLEATEEELRRLVEAGVVAGVVEDVPEPMTLQDSGPLINADDAAALGADGAGQGIAVLDTGVETGHAFFGGRVVAEACFSSNSVVDGASTVCPGGGTAANGPGAAAPCGHVRCDHGTHVAGIAAGADPARSGVAPRAEVQAVQVFSLFTDAAGGPQTCADAGTASPCVLSYRSDQIRGLQQVLDWSGAFPIAAVNMSIGGGDFAACEDDPRRPLVDQLRAAGIATVISSGNDGLTAGVGAPGCIAAALTVGNTTKADAVSGTSNSADIVDLLAPGTGITSSVLGGAFGAKSGTSMAAPQVAGAGAALRSARPDLTVDQIEQVLENTGTGILDARNGLTRPRIDLAAAVQSVRTPVWTDAIWRSTGETCTGDSCPGWTRLDNNPRTVKVAAGDDLYQLHGDGSVWRSTGAACDGDSCPGWVRLDNNPMTADIAAAGSNLYQLHRDGRIWRSTGAVCSGESCPGWEMLDNNPMAVAIAAADAGLYQLHRDGAVWRSAGAACIGESCPGWERLDNNPMTAGIVAAGDRLFQLHADGRVWRSTGAACSGDSCPGWEMLDNNPRTIKLVAGNDLHQLHGDASIWRSTGEACSGDSCPGWVRLDNNPMAADIAAAGPHLYQLHRDGGVWRSTGGVCDGESCPGWVRLDNNSATASIAAAGDQLYQMHGSGLAQLHEDGRIWQATGQACDAAGCGGWQMIDNNPATQAIAAGDGLLFQLHADGRIWRSTGQPCQGESCPGWEMLDNNPATRAIAAGAGHLYQLHTDGRVWRSTGAMCSGESCPGWQMLNNNPATQAIAAAGGWLYQLHADGRIWRSTGAPCSGETCPGWQMLDNNPATRAIAAGGGHLYQLHADGRVWRSTGGVCSGESCPGWEMLDNNPSTQALAAAGGQLYQRHDTGAIWRSTGQPCRDGGCPGWQRLDDNLATHAIAAGHAE